MRFIQLRSAPAEKLLPSEASITTRTLASLPTCSNAAESSAMMASSKALCLSGLFMVMVATPRSSTRVTTVVFVSVIFYLAKSGGLHSEDTKLGVLDFFVQAG